MYKCNIGELFSFHSGLGIPREQLGDKGIPYLHYGDMHRGSFSSVSYDDYVNLPKYDIEINGDEDFLLKDGDVVFLDASEDLAGTSRCVVVHNPDNKPFIAGLHTLIAKPLNNSLNKSYKKYFTQTQDVQKQFECLAVGFKVYGVNRNSIKKVIVSFPKNIKEQNKIAKILTKWDEAIELQERLIEKLELQKKGLMQTILKSQKDWKSIKIADLGTTYNGLSNKTKEDFGYGKYYIPYMNVYTNSIINEDFLECVKIEKNENQAKVIYGDVLFTISSETPEEVGVSSVYLGHETELFLNSFCFGFRINDFKKLLPEFAAYYFRSIQFKKILNKLAQGVTRFNLGKENLLKENIIIPNIKEQISISKKLMNAENILKLHSQKLDLIKHQRKALMQRLLTGAVRVKV